MNADRDIAITAPHYASGGYAPKDIGDFFGFHCPHTGKDRSGRATKGA